MRPVSREQAPAIPHDAAKERARTISILPILGLQRLEPTEVDERRYDWEPSETSLPIVYEGLAGIFIHHAPPGQGGTH